MATASIRVDIAGLPAFQEFAERAADLLEAIDQASGMPPAVIAAAGRLAQAAADFRVSDDDGEEHIRTAMIRAEADPGLVGRAGG